MLMIWDPIYQPVANSPPGELIHPNPLSLSNDFLIINPDFQPSDPTLFCLPRQSLFSVLLPPSQSLPSYGPRPWEPPVPAPYNRSFSRTPPSGARARKGRRQVADRLYAARNKVSL
jgi:hypothetical protein